MNRVATVELAPQATANLPNTRVRAAGKFLFTGDEKFWVRGVTYGAFRPDAAGDDYPSEQVIERDFAAMTANGINALRTYTAPPLRVLDCAARHGLRIMIGLPWEQHVTFLESSADSIEMRVRAMVKTCAGHPAVLCYAIGNEIPSSIVRWYGGKRIQRFLYRLYLAAKEEDESALFTYVNYPTTEYLELPWIDLVCFNVYLESRDRLEDYLGRLQNLAHDKPLIMAEVGLDAMRHGEEGQARSLEWQIGAAFSAGCAGVFVFSWTDEWYRGGADVKDWKFGLTSEHRGPKPALAAVRAQFSDSPFAERTTWPRISVIVSSYNGSATIRETCEGLSRLDYPNHEVIVVNDGSTDRTAEIVAEYPFQLISTGNRGLSSARNMGMEAASGEIVAYIDDDAYPDRDWLRYLALAFLRGKYVGVGGPNLPPPGDGEIAECVANAPGGPMHVLLTDREAEHVPGCNMAFRKDALVAIGGFDPIYRVAGDDVDICWRLQELDGVIGFAPTAVVWHHRRNSVAMFLKQQRGYGKAEALLELKWPRRHNVFGHASWAGRMYGNGAAVKLGRSRIYQGTWGTAPFQLLYRSSNSALLSLFSMPEWHLVIAGLLFLSALSWIWRPLAFCIPLLIVALALPLAQAAIGASRAKYSTPARGMRHRLRRFALTAFLHLVQPFARLLGRMQHGLTPWRIRNVKTSTKLFRGVLSLWREHWEEPAKSLRELSERLEARGAVVAVGGDYDHWDLEVRVGTFGGARIIMATEEHGEGRQMLRFRVSPFVGRFPIVLISVCGALAMAAAFDSAWVITGMFAVFIVLIGCVAVIHVARATALVRSALRRFGAR